MVLMGFGNARQEDLGGNAYRDRQGNQGRHCGQDFSGTGEPPPPPGKTLGIPQRGNHRAM